MRGFAFRWPNVRSGEALAFAIVVIGTLIWSSATMALSGTTQDNSTASSSDACPAAVTFRYVPSIGGCCSLDGYVTGFTPADFKIAVYIKVAGYWWTKPFANSPLTTIQPDGNWSSAIVTGGIDEQATHIVAYLLPNGIEPPLLLGGSDLPPELASYPQRMIDRTQPPAPEPLCMFTRMVGVVPTANDPGGGMSWGDYDSDGDMDLLQTRILSGPHTPHIFRNNGGAFSDVTASLASFAIGSLAWGDYDGDGDLDLLMVGETSSELLAKIYRNDGNDSFADIDAPLEGVTHAAAAWGDYDGDGDLDALLTGGGSKTFITKIYRNDGGGAFTDIGAALPGIRDGAVAWGDYDNDGDLDLLFTGWSVPNLELIARIYRNDGNGIFTDVGGGLPGVLSGSTAWGDYDNDGDLDILLIGGASIGPISRVYRNNGDNSFTDIYASIEGVYNGTAAWGDYDNDGDLDILITGSGANGGVTRLYRNDGADAFSDTQAPFPPLSESAAAWGDYDNDGDLDIILSNNTDYGDRARYRISWLLRNDVSTSNTTPVTPSGLVATATDTGVTLSWSVTSDAQTPAPGLSYNACLGTSSGACQIIAAHADRSTGFRRLAGVGNAGMRTFTTVLGLTPGATYYWSVQAVDSAFAGSSFAEERSFVFQQISPLQVTIAATNGHDINLEWSHDSQYVSYEIWRLTKPYDGPDHPSARLVASGLPPLPACTSDGLIIRCTDPDVPGTPSVSAYYLVKGRLAGGLWVDFNHIGAFSFTLAAGE